MNGIQKAKEFATKAHEGQVRKFTGENFINHPLEVGEILESLHFSEDIIIAGILHDTIEDTDTTVSDLRIAFGDEIAETVKAVTHGNGDWIEDRLKYIKNVKWHGHDAIAVALADKIANIGDFTEEMERGGILKRVYRKQWFVSSILMLAYELENDHLALLAGVLEKRMRDFNSHL